MITTFFDKNVTCGNDFLGVTIIENNDELKIGNIWLPSTAEANSRLAFAKVTSVGKAAFEKTGCKVGDYIMIDRLATFSHTAPSACLKYDSVICLTNEENNEFYPIKDMMFVDPEEHDDITDVGGVYIQGYQDKLRLGKVTKMNFEPSEEYPFKIGDRVMLSKGADNVQLGETHLFIYKKDMIVCKVED